MAKQRKKADFPTKICPVCGLSFTWRKKWSKCWEEVKYCSEKCRRSHYKIPQTMPIIIDISNNS